MLIFAVETILKDLIEINKNYLERHNRHVPRESQYLHISDQKLIDGQYKGGNRFSNKIEEVKATSEHNSPSTLKKSLEFNSRTIEPTSHRSNNEIKAYDRG